MLATHHVTDDVTTNPLARPSTLLSFTISRMFSAERGRREEERDRRGRERRKKARKRERILTVRFVRFVKNVR